MSNINFTIGCDPEVFVKERFTGRLVSAAGLITGDKKNPTPVKGGAIQVDGLALEFNTEPVGIDEGFSAFDAKVLTVLVELANAVPYHKVVYEGSVVFDKDYYDKEVPESAKELGCDPDFNAYEGGKKNPTPDSDTSMRGAAGHLHIGWGEDIPSDHPDHVAICCDFIKCLDAYVGIATTLFESEAALVRKSAYGKAGAFRPKSYGVEYRTPSNEWIINTQRRRLIWNCVSAAILDMQRGDEAEWKRIAENWGLDIQDMINNPSGYRCVNMMEASGYRECKAFSAYYLYGLGIRDDLVADCLVPS